MKKKYQKTQGLINPVGISFLRKGILLVTLLLLISFNSVFSHGIITTSKDTVCQGDEVVYTYHPDTTLTGIIGYAWTVLTNLSYTSSGSTCDVLWGNTGTDTVYVLVYNGSSGHWIDSVAYIVTVHPNPVPVIHTLVNVGCLSLKDTSSGGVSTEPAGRSSDTCFLVCDSTLITFYTDSVPPGNTYLWSAPNGIIYSSTTGASFTVSWLVPNTEQSVNLTVTNQWGCLDSTSICIKVIQRPHADIYVDSHDSINMDTIYACLGGAGVQFFGDSSSSSNSSSIVTWFWNFGDGNTSTDENPTHSYSTPGLFRVTLTVTNGCGCMDSTSIYVRVNPKNGPTIECPTTICAGDTSNYWTSAICSNYIWSVTGGTIISSPINRDTIRVVWGNGNSGPGIITLQLDPSCDSTFCQYPVSVEVPIVPLQGVIYGPTIVCPTTSTTVPYSMNCIPGILYHWAFADSLSPHGTITSGQGTSTVNILWFSSGTDTIIVNYTNLLLGCSGTATLVVHITTTFQIIGNIVECDGDTSVYTTSPVASFKWVMYNDFGPVEIDSGYGPSFSQIWPYSTNIQNYTIYAIDTTHYFCNSPQNINVTVYPAPVIPGAIIPSDSCICLGGTSYYSSIPTSSNYYLQWTIIGGTPTNAVGNSVAVTWNTTGPYKVILQQGMIAPPHCLSLPETLVVHICSPPTGNITGPDTVCINIDTTYNFPQVNGTYTWSIIPSTLGSVINGQGTNSIHIQWNVAAGLATIQLAISVCGNITNFAYNVVITPPPIPYITVSHPACAGDAVSFTIPIGDFSGTNTYLWSIGNSIATTTNTSSWSEVFNVAGSDTVHLTVADINNCLQAGYSSAIFHVNAMPTDSIYTLDSTIICNPSTFPDTLYSVATPSSVTYQWYGPSGAMGTGYDSLIVRGYGSYYCVVTSDSGCSQISNYISIDTCPTSGPPPHLCPQSVTFTHTEHCGYATFSGTLTPGYTTPVWDFGDGNYAYTAPNVTHTYSQAGIYTVSLCVDYPSDTCQVCYTDTIVVPVIPNFSVSYSCNNTSGMSTTLTDSSSAVVAITSCMWSISPGPPTSASGSPVTLSLSGTQTITMTVTLAGYPDICSVTKTVTIPIQPAASFTIHPNPACAGSPVFFQNTSTDSTAIINYTWNFGDGSGSNIPDPSRVYTLISSIPQTFYPTLTITDMYGCTSSASGSISVYPNTISLIIVPNPQPACEGSTVTLTANSTSSYGPLTYLWLPGDSTNNFIRITQPNIYTVIVKDSKGCTKTKSDTVSFETVPTPVIVGPTNYCDGDQMNLSMFAGPTYTYTWTVSPGPAITYTGTSLPNTSPPYTYPFIDAYSPYTVTGYITNNSPITCVESITELIYVHPLPAVPVIDTPNLCLKNPPVILTATDIDPVIFTWSNGNSGPILSVTQPGLYEVMATDSFGCKSNSVAVYVPPLPDFCNIFTGCICDTGNRIIQIPTSFTVIGWLKNGLPYTSLPHSEYYNFPLDSPGTYQVIVENMPNCPDTSGYIYVEDCQPALCCCCDSSIVYFKVLTCIGPDSLGYEQYQFDIYYDYTGASPTPFSIIVSTPSNGLLGSISSTILNPGVNDITGIFTNVPPVSINFCLSIIHGDSIHGGQCKQDVCALLPQCDSLPPCNQEIGICNKSGHCILCGGNDPNGNPIYQIYFYISYTGSNNSTFYISSSEGTFSSLSSSIVNNGYNQYSVFFTDMPPWDGYICMNVIIRDSVTGVVCSQEVCFALPDCIQYCDEKVTYKSGDCYEVDSLGHWIFDLYFVFTNTIPNAKLTIVSPDGFITYQSIVYPPLGANSIYILYDNFTNADPICFRFIFTDTVTGSQCADTLCIDHPDCCVGCEIAYPRLTLQPNPANNQVGINYFFPLAGDNEILISDVHGNEISRIIPTNTNGSITYITSSLSTGIYLVSYERDGKLQQSTKLIISRQ